MRQFGRFVLLAFLLGEALIAPPARADNAMGYRLFSEQEAASLPRSSGALGLTVSRTKQITDAALTFDVMEVTAVRPGSAGGQAGFRQGDQIIAVNGLVFPSLKAFAAYVGSMQPGSVATIDYMPSGGGPAQAQRIAVTVGGARQTVQRPDEDRQGGLSLGTKLSIGAGAVALFGCYELGCFSHHQGPQTGQAPSSR
jgi:membrane-associated protease RseP (regulator of RpoE activity)